MINIPVLNKIPKNIAKLLTQIVKISVTVLVVYIVIKKLGWENIVTTFKKTNLIYAFYGLVCCVVSIFLGALQWHLLMHRKEVKIPYRETFELYYIGMFFNNIGTLAGDTIKVAYIKSRHSHGKLGFAATFLDRFAGLLALIVFASAGCIYMVTHGELHTQNELLIAKIVMGLVCMMGVMLLFLLMRRLRRLLMTIIEKLPIPKKQLLKDVIAATGLTYHQYPFVIGIGFLSMLIQALRIGTHIFSAAALGILTIHNFVYFFIFIPLIALFMIIPLPFGIRETVGGSLFSLTGIPVQSAFVMQFMATFIGVIGSLWGGIEFLINRRGKKDIVNKS
ncbi:MAG: flippase-like domain-containing protein [Fibrobacter sp.]|nr:flippase-like domain-containing protein [Fibrobacter sp.]